MMQKKGKKVDFLILFDMEKFEIYLDIFYLYINRRYSRSNNMPFITGIKRNIGLITYVFIRFAKDIIPRIRNHKNTDIKKHLIGKKWIFYDSINNYNTLEFLIKDVSNIVVVHYNGHKNFRDFAVNLDGLITYRPAFKKYLFLMYLFFKREYTALFYQFICKYFHLYQDYIKILQDCKPECIFISNDHFPKSRALIVAAKKCNVPIFYFQHASVSNIFPPLKFTASFLYGEYSKNIYKNIKGTQGNIHLIGNHRYDGLSLNLNFNIKITHIGLAYNNDDSLDIIESISVKILSCLPDCTLIIRKHPRDYRTLSLREDSRLKFSDSWTETSIDFLNNVDCLIAGNSSILLEGALLNLKPIYYKMNTSLDYYGFVKEGLAIEAQNSLDLIKELSSPKGINYRSRAKVYDASIDSHFEFKSSKQALEILNNIYNIS